MARRTRLDAAERVEGQLMLDYPDLAPETALEALGDQQLTDRGSAE